MSKRIFANVSNSSYAEFDSPPPISDSKSNANSPRPTFHKVTVVNNSSMGCGKCFCFLEGVSEGRAVVLWCPLCGLATVPDNSIQSSPQGKFFRARALPDTGKQLEEKISGLLDRCVTQSENNVSKKFLEQIRETSNFGLEPSYRVGTPKKTMSGKDNIRADLDDRFAKSPQQEHATKKKKKKKGKEKEKKKNEEETIWNASTGYWQSDMDKTAGFKLGTEDKFEDECGGGREGGGGSSSSSSSNNGISGYYYPGNRGFSDVQIGTALEWVDEEFASVDETTGPEENASFETKNVKSFSPIYAYLLKNAEQFYTTKRGNKTNLTPFINELVNGVKEILEEWSWKFPDNDEKLRAKIKNFYQNIMRMKS
ncbi:hypothetical protein ScalyP_jg2110 [Parmales sp. scaly parma]|nr:hypothetical protein ScalyP_jg2110 [Parmales sp. scaly parma]